MPSVLLLALCSVVLSATACASADMSAADHRARAAEEQDAAARHGAAYDAGARAMRVETPAGSASFAPEEYNPTHWAQEAAASHTSHAQEHLDAAHALEASEDAACVGIAPAARGACPLLRPVTVDDVAGGVRVALRDEAAATSALKVIRCQQAFARTRGFKDVPTCILYAPGLEATQSGSAIALVAKADADIARLRANVRAHQPQ